MTSAITILISILTFALEVINDIKQGNMYFHLMIWKKNLMSNNLKEHLNLIYEHGLVKVQLNDKPIFPYFVYGTWYGSMNTT